MSAKSSTYEDSVTLSQEEISAYLAAFGEKKVCLREAVLLIPVEKVYALLDINVRSLWEAIKEVHRGLPTSKTALKYLSESASDVSTKRQHRFIRAVPIPRQSTELSIAQMEKGFTVPTVTNWLGLLELSRLDPVVLDYWKPKLFALSDLSLLPNKRARFAAYTSSEVVAQLGCPASRQSILNLFHDLSEEGLVQSRALTQMMSADGLATLLRLAAWFMADSQVGNWEFELEEGTQNVIHAVWVIPTWCASSQSWSNPMQTALEKLASLAGLTKKRPGPVTHLGKLWAAQDGVEPESRIRLLRNWLQLKGGRPSFQKLLDLIKVSYDVHMQQRGGLQHDTKANYWHGACVFRLAETMSLLIRDLTRSGWPTELVISLMGVYETEYRMARRLLGKPLEN
ncbi:hypothetical protein HU720_04305 [Pseudomonas sp. SWRI51]|uniref:hypothetical protein n=1 Tax=Pseudomonas sp. SWRI51 TaxID=2745491 RepID=UPI0016483D86|nr:hypothetical protein [Pseudomonas sp. SWRI51]MBC3410518.1 hypothetical protein [Pseudomonas sp. SWRI51]